MTSSYTLIDTYPAFLAYWERARHQTIDVQLENWAEGYMVAWPELLRLQLDSYAKDGEDWRQVAEEHVFPGLEMRTPVMRVARENLRAVCGPLWERAQDALGLDFPITFVIYVGIGCGAGWAAEYDGLPAVLFGLENIAEEGWQERNVLEGLLAHEIGHLAHFSWRDEARIPRGEGPYWQLYSEGFAQYCEHHVLGEPSWHMAVDLGEDWLVWCRENRSWLAREFLRAVKAGEMMRPFFGSWYDIQGYKQTGYYLGQELVRPLVERIGLKSAALLEQFEVVMVEALEDLAGGK